MRSARLAKVLVPAIFASLSLVGCDRGMTIRNTSNAPVTFTQRLHGGERSYTLDPGSTLDLAPSSVVNLGAYTITAK